MPTSYLPPEDDGPEPNTLRIENQVLRKGFTLIPNVVLKARGLSRDAKLLYGMLLSYAWQTGSCFPGYETLQADLQCGSAQVAKYLRELKDAGLIDVKRRGQGKTSLYTIRDLPEPKDQDAQNGRASSFKTKGQALPKRKREEYSVEEDPEEYHSEISKRTAEPLSDNPTWGNSKFRKGLRPVLTEGESGSPERDASEQVTNSARRAARVRPAAESATRPTIAARQPQLSPVAGDGMTRISEVLAAAGIAVKRAKVDQRSNPEPERLNSLARPPASATPDPPEHIDFVIEDISTKLRDTEHLASNITQARRLWQSSGQSVEDFVALLYGIRETVRWKANVQSRMPYFFKCVKVALGLEPNPNPAPTAKPRRNPNAPAAPPAQPTSLAGQYAHLVRR